MPEELPELQHTPHQQYWGTIAAAPELVVADPDSDEALQLGHEALKLFFAVQESEETLGVIFNHYSDGRRKAAELYGGSEPALVFDSVKQWYSMLGPTNSMEGAQYLLWDAASEVEGALEQQDVPSVEMSLLAATLYHEAAELFGPIDDEAFKILCARADSLYRRVVLVPPENGTKLRRWATHGTRGVDQEEVRAVFFATNRYHDLKFLRLRSDLAQTLNGHEFDQAGTGLAIDDLRSFQMDALWDIRAATSLLEPSTSRRAALSPGMFIDPLAVLVARNRQIVEASREGTIDKVYDMAVRNAFPREAIPVEGMPQSLRVGVVMTRYARTGARMAIQRCNTKPSRDQYVPEGILPLYPTTNSRHSKSSAISAKNVQLWTGQLQEELTILPGDLNAQHIIRQRHPKTPQLPFIAQLEAIQLS